MLLFTNSLKKYKVCAFRLLKLDRLGQQGARGIANSVFFSWKIHEEQQQKKKEEKKKEGTS